MGKKGLVGTEEIMNIKLQVWVLATNHILSLKGFFIRLVNNVDG